MKRIKRVSNRGLTLVELMVVIVLLAILAAAAGPTVTRSLERSNAKGVATEIANTLRTARNQAVSRGVPLRVVTTANAVVIHRPPAVVTSCRDTWDHNADTAVHTFTVGSRSGKHSIQSVDHSVLCFSPDGRVLSQTGAVLSAANSCMGEVARIATVRTGAALGGASKDCPTAANRVTQRDLRDQVDMYVVSVGYNGQVRVNQ